MSRATLYRPAPDATDASEPTEVLLPDACRAHPEGSTGSRRLGVRTRPPRAGLVAGLLVAVLLIMPALAGCSSGRSIDAYCRTFIEEGQKFRASYSGTSTQDPLSALVQLLGAPQELAIMFKKLQKVSPDDIEPDVEVLQKAFQKVADDAADNASNPVRGALEALMLGASTKGPTDRVNAYTAKNCGPLPGAEQPSSSSAPAAPVSSSATPSTPASSGPAEAGSVVLDSDRVDEACDADDVDISAGSANFQLWIRSGGIAVFTCLGKTLVAYDLVNRVKLWDTTLTDSTVGVEATDAHVYLVDETKHEATGLEAAYTSTELSAIDLKTGDPDWQVPLNDWTDNGDRPSSETLKVVEDPTQSDDPSVTVTFGTTTSFSAATGKERWHRASWKDDDDRTKRVLDDDGFALTPDITMTAEDANDDGSGGQVLVGRATRTAKKLWSLLPPKGVNPNDYGSLCGTQHVLEGSRLWCGHGGWSETIDVVTGRRISSLVLRGQKCYGTCHVSPYGTLVIDDGKLSFYTDPDAPAWQVKATAANIGVAGIGPEHLLLSAESGAVLIDTSDGSTVPGGASVAGADLGEFSSDSFQVGTFSVLVPQYDNEHVVMIDLPS